MENISKKHKDSFLGEEKIGRLLFKLSLPSVIGMLVHALYNFVDAIFIGQGVGTNGIGGLAIAFPFQMLIMAMAGLIGIGAASVVSRNLGSGHREKAYTVAGNALLLAILFGLFSMTAGTLLLDPILRLFGATDVLMSYSREYISVILLGAVFGTFGMVSNNLVRSEGQAIVAMVTMLSGTFLNIILDPIFIFGLEMGMRGAAIATVISQFASFCFLVLYFLSGRSSLKIRWKHFRLKTVYIKEIMIIGFPSFVRQSGSSILMILINNSLARYGGDIYIAVFGVINRFFMILFMSVFGVVQGVQPIIGYNFGAGKIDRIKQGMKLAILTTTIISTLFFIVLMSFPTQMISIFNNDAELVAVGSHAIRIIMLAMPIVGYQIITSAFFQAVGKAKPALILGLSRQFLFLIPLVLIFPIFFGVNGIWLSFPIADFLSTTITTIWFLKEMRQISSQNEGEAKNLSISSQN